MGLSGRRRARKETRGQTKLADFAADDAEHHRSGGRARTGNTYRRVHPDSARDRAGAGLLAFKVNRSWSNDLMPRKQAPHPEIGADPNANLYGRDMLHVMDADYDSRVVYSLNKQRRWKFISQLADKYHDSDELKAQNVFLIESEARGSKGGDVRRMATNTGYIASAADELRQHKKELWAKLAYTPRQMLMEGDSFEFSGQVKQKQSERPLASICSASRGGAINAKSVRCSCNLWNKLYNVSPKAEKVRLAMQRDYEGRMEVVVGTCARQPGLDVTRCRHEKDFREQRTKSIKENRDAGREKFINRMIKKMQRRDLDLQLELDGDAEEVADIYEADGSGCMPVQRCAVTIFDAMKSQVNAAAANRVNKLAVKARKMKLALRCQRKLRSDSDQQTVGSSGYDSGSESHEDGNPDVAEAETETEAANARLAAAVDAALAADRKLAQIPREASEAERLISLFADSGAERALVIGSSLPRKLAVLLLPDLSETIVFEEAAAQENPDFVAYAVHHACSGDQVPRTSALEVTLHPDPFAFLRSLMAAPSTAAQKALPTAETKSLAGLAAVGWRRAEALKEPDARLAAIRALPMFSVPSVKVDDDVELVPGAECEICCQQLNDQPSQDGAQFAQGSTMLVQCGHSFCNRCWLHHVASCVASGRVDISCPGYKCQATLDVATLLWFCPGELLPALRAAAFRAWLTDRRQGCLRRLCPRRSCGVLEGPPEVNAVCGTCRASLCLGCGQEPHWPTDCSTAARYRTKMHQLGHSKLHLRDLDAKVDVNAKQCPACQLVMEKGVGCNHMSCPCGEHFCWWCGQPMRAHSGGPCNGGTGTERRTRSEFHVQRVLTATDSILVPSSSVSRMYCEAVRVRLHRRSPRLRSDSATLLAVSDLFLSYAIRFPAECRDNWPEARRFAERAARRLIDGAVRASYLAEYSFAHLDSHRWGDRRARMAVRAIGGHVGELATVILSEAGEQCRGGYRGPKQTRLGCERLLMMLACLRGKCRMLHGAIAGRREGPTPWGS